MTVAINYSIEFLEICVRQSWMSFVKEVACWISGKSQLRISCFYSHHARALTLLQNYTIQLWSWILVNGKYKASVVDKNCED